MRQSSCTTLEAPWRGDTCPYPPPAIPVQPASPDTLTNRTFLTRSRSRGFPQQEHRKDKGKGKRGGGGGVQGQGQQTGIRHQKKKQQQNKLPTKSKNGSIGRCSEVRRCKQRKKFCVCAPKMKKNNKKKKFEL